jgi:nucleotide-binding universal stress UspA family protein
MSRIRRVLYPTDFSAACRGLAPAVRRMVESWQAEVTLLHVLEGRPRFAPPNELEDAMSVLEAIGEKELPFVRVNPRVERGRPAERILQYAQSHGVDLIVTPARMPSAGRQPFGVVTEEILAAAPCAVWLDWTPRPADVPVDGRRVCCALDFDGSEELVLREAAALANERRTGLAIVHAFDPDGLPAAGAPLSPRARARELLSAEMRVDALRRRFAAAAGAIVESGTTEAIVGRAVRSLEAGLLVTGRQRESILAAAPVCPVWSIAAGAYRRPLSAQGPQLGSALRNTG